MCRDININWQPYACMQTRILQVILLDPCCCRVNTSPLLCLTWMATYWRVEVTVSSSTPGKHSETKCYAYIVIAVIISEIQYTYIRKSFAVDHLLSCIEVTKVRWEQGFHVGGALLPCVSDEGVVWPVVAWYLGSEEVIKYCELKLLFNCARVYADTYLGNSVSVRLLFYILGKIFQSRTVVFIN